MCGTVGIIVLPSSGFAPVSVSEPSIDSGFGAGGQGEEGDDKGEIDECLRFSISNITDDDVRALAERLRAVGEDWSLERGVRKLVAER